MNVRVGTSILAVLIASLVAFSAPGRADFSSKKVELPKLRELMEQQNEKLGSGCGVGVHPVGVSGRYALVLGGLWCAEGEGKDRTVRGLKSYQAVVDWKRVRLVGEEIEVSPGAKPLSVVELEWGPAIFGTEKGELVLRIVGEEKVETYRWKCPGSECPGDLKGQIIQGSAFPGEPLRVALVGGDEFLVRVFDLYAPEEAGRPGWVREVDRLVPLGAWRQDFRKVTALEEEIRRVFLDSSVLTKIASMIPLLNKPLERELEEFAERIVAHAPEGMSMVFVPERGLFLVTQQPFSLTWVDTKTGKFSVRPMSAFGAHARAISFAGNLSVLGAFPDRGRAVRLFVTGGICEPMDSYGSSDPGRSCPHRMVGPVTDEEVCCYNLFALVRHDLATDETDWQLWDGETNENALLVEPGKPRPSCLKGSAHVPVLVLDRCGSR